MAKQADFLFQDPNWGAEEGVKMLKGVGKEFYGEFINKNLMSFPLLHSSWDFANDLCFQSTFRFQTDRPSSFRSSQFPSVEILQRLQARELVAAYFRASRTREWNDYCY